MYLNGIETNDNTIFNSLLFASGQVILSDSERNLFTESVMIFNNIKQLRMKISPLKSKVMSFKGQVPIISKVVMFNTILEQMNTFSYLGCNVSCEEGKIDSKNNFYIF
jgi:hypothetical protein